MRRERSKPTPLDGPKLDELALAYVARFATTRARLVSYLRRKLRERGWSGEDDPPVEAVADRLVEARYVDDEVYARAKSGRLLRRGYGARRVDQALGAAGVAAETRDRAMPDEHGQRAAALAMAKKRRFGPFDTEARDPARREKQLAAMLRAGHPLDKSRAIIDAGSIDVAEAWVDEAADGD